MKKLTEPVSAPKHAGSLSPQGTFLVAQMVKNTPAKQESPVRFLVGKDPMEEETATHSSILFFFFFHSSILAQRIPWIAESGGLQSMGLQRICN